MHEEGLLFRCLHKGLQMCATGTLAYSSEAVPISLINCADVMAICMPLSDMLTLCHIGLIAPHFALWKRKKMPDASVHQHSMLRRACLSQSLWQLVRFVCVAIWHFSLLVPPTLWQPLSETYLGAQPGGHVSCRPPMICKCKWYTD